MWFGVVDFLYCEPHSEVSKMADFSRYPQPTSIIPTIIPTEKSGSRRPLANAYERVFRVNLLKIRYLCLCEEVREGTEECGKVLNWLPPRDSNPDMLIQSQLSCR